MPSPRPTWRACDDCDCTFKVPSRGMIPERCPKCRALRVKDIARQYRQVHAAELRQKRIMRDARA